MNQRARRARNRSEIKHSKDGIFATILSLLSGFLILASVALSIAFKGLAGGWIGLMGVLALLLAVLGIGFSVVSWKDEDRIDTYKRIGTGLSVLVTVLNVILIILGLFHRG